MEIDIKTSISIKEVGKTLRRELSRTASASVSWDTVFSTVGPALLDEATQRDLRPYLDEMLTARVQDQVHRDVRRWATDNKISLEGAIRLKGSTSEDDLATILLQLRALGLVTKSERRRSVSDKATYWTLTPYGDSHLTALRAIRRAGGTPSPAPRAPAERHTEPQGVEADGER